MRNSLISVLTVAAVLSPAAAFAAPHGGVIRGNVITPTGFCTVHQDGTKGVRFDATSYTAFLAEHAADKVNLAKLIEQAKIEATKNGGAPLMELQIGQLAAKVKKQAAELQRMRVNQGQNALCR